MKQHITTLLMALVLTATIGATAQSQEVGNMTIQDRSGAPMGYITSNGVFQDRSRVAIGSFQRGTVRDQSGVAMGSIRTDGRIYDRSGVLMGRVDPNGTLYDRAGARVGRIDADGTIRNRSGVLRGQFQGYSPEYRHTVVAYLFFLNHFHQLL